MARFGHWKDWDRVWTSKPQACGDRKTPGSKAECSELTFEASMDLLCGVGAPCGKQSKRNGVPNKAPLWHLPPMCLSACARNRNYSLVATEYTRSECQTSGIETRGTNAVRCGVGTAPGKQEGHNKRPSRSLIVPLVSFTPLRSLDV